MIDYSDTDDKTIKRLAAKIDCPKARNRFIRSAKKLGRPTKYSQDLAMEAYALWCAGKGVAQVAAELGVCRQTLHNWKDDPKYNFMDVFKKGKNQSKAWWDDFRINNLNDPTFQYIAFIDGYKRMHAEADDAKINIPGFGANNDMETNIKAVTNAVANQDISPKQGVDMMDLLSKAYTIEEVEKVKEELAILREQQKAN